MSDIAIRVAGISKKYQLGARVEKNVMLRDLIADTAMKPIRAVSSAFRRGGDADPGRVQETLWALRDLSFEVNQGEVVGVIGRNGAGKSTLLKVLSRITDPTSGYAEIHGRVGSLLEVGTGFHPDLTGRENIFLNGAILGMRRREIESKFDDMVAFAEVEKFIDTPVKRYSSGMYLRLAFAVAAHLQPEILVVDEVLAVGDSTFQKKCLGKMQDVAEQGRTVLFVSHNMAAITRLCSRAIMLQEGRVVEDGPASKVVTAYLARAGDGGGMRTWSVGEAPGTKELKLISVSLTRNGGQPVAIANVQDELMLNISYFVVQPSLRFRCFVGFYTQGVCAFSASEPTEVAREKPGLYCSQVRIPAHMLAEGEYSINISIFASRGAKAHYAKVHDVAVFQMNDAIDGTSARGDYTEGFDGVLRPKLDWDMQYLDSAAPL